MSVNPAEARSWRWSLRDPTARGPDRRARRRRIGSSPGATKIVVYAMRPPGRSKCLSARSTASLRRSQHNTSVSTMASNEAGRERLRGAGCDDQ